MTKYGLTRVIAEALGCEERIGHGGEHYCRTHNLGRDTGWPCSEAETVAAALAPLIGFGYEAERVVPTLDAIQNAVAATGGSNQDIAELTSIIAKIGASAKITAEDIISVTGADITAAALAPLIEARVREARAEAWDEGHAIGAHDQVNLALFNIKPTPNPYREDETDA